MDLLPIAAANGGPRKAQALLFICDYIVSRGHSPAMSDIARGLDVSRQRASELVDQLTLDGSVVRLPGAQRAITVPGLTQRIAIAQLRALGFRVDEDILTIGGQGLAESNLSLVAIIEHLPGDDETRQ